MPDPKALAPLSPVVPFSPGQLRLKLYGRSIVTGKEGIALHPHPCLPWAECSFGLPSESCELAQNWQGWVWAEGSMGGRGQEHPVTRSGGEMESEMLAE